MNIEDVFINYIDLNEKKNNPLVLLHGWGQNIEMMMPIARNFNDNRIVLIDLPGFGKSNEPTYDFKLEDYTRIIKKLLDELNISNPILIGHSFGGKISLLYASTYDVKKLVLLGSPYKKEIKELSLQTKILKFLTKVPVVNKLEEFGKKHIGSRDYKSASNTMRKVLVNHINEDLTDKLNEIKCPTLLIWGSKDKEVPLSNAYEMEKLIKDSAVIVYENGTHYAYLENLDQTINIINSFIAEK